MPVPIPGGLSAVLERLPDESTRSQQEVPLCWQGQGFHLGRRAFDLGEYPARHASFVALEALELVLAPARRLAFRARCSVLGFASLRGARKGGFQMTVSTATASASGGLPAPEVADFFLVYAREVPGAAEGLAPYVAVC